MMFQLNRTDGGGRGVAPNVVAACVAIFVAYVPISALTVALTPIGTSLRASTSDLTWVLDAFVLPLAAFILTAGTVADIHGRKRVLLGGLALLAIGSGVGLGSHSSIHLLWVAQAIGGTGAAMVLPSSLAVIANAIPDPRRRAPAIGAWASALGLGLLCGSFIAALVIQGLSLSWQWLYAAILVLAVVGIGVVGFAVDESSAPEGRSLDGGGQLAVVAFVVALAYALIEVSDHGWGSILVIVALAIAAVSLASFIAIERRVVAPMLDLGLFRSAAFSATSVVAALVMFGLIGTLFVLSLFFGVIQQHSVIEIAERFGVLTAAIVIAGPLAHRLTARVGPRWSVTGGLIVAGGALLTLTTVNADGGLSAVWWPLGLLGVGFGFVLGPMTAAAVASVPHRLAGLAGSANNAFRQTGGVLGPALLGTILTSRLTHAFPGQLAGQGVHGARARDVVATLHHAGIGGLTALPHTAQNQAIARAGANAFSYGMHVAAVVGGGALLFAALLAAALLGARGQKPANAHAAAHGNAGRPETASVQR